MLIIDMPMPKNCGECPLIYMEIVKCTVTGGDCTEYGAERPSWCPIKGELVRCGECNYAREITGGVRLDGSTIWCNHIGQYTTADWFCADGERKDGAE